MMQWIRDRRIARMSSGELYDLVEGEAANLIASASPVDPDNGRAAPYKLNMGTSDVLGILLALKRRGYSIRKSFF